MTIDETTRTVLLIGSGGLAGAMFTLAGQLLVRWLRRPRLMLLKYEQRAPMYRLAPDVQSGVRMYWVNVGVRNRGRWVAERCRAVLAAVAEQRDGVWIRESNWLPLDLKWALYDDGAAERDLIPEPRWRVRRASSPVVYYFNIAYIAEDRQNQLLLPVLRIPSAQRTVLPVGTFAFHVLLYAANGTWVSRWYKVSRRGRSGDFDASELEVRELRKQPCLES